MLRDTDEVRSSPGLKELIRRKTDQKTYMCQGSCLGQGNGCSGDPERMEKFCRAVGKLAKECFQEKVTFTLDLKDE